MPPSLRLPFLVLVHRAREVVLHAADLGGQTMEMSSALAWGRWVNEEFAQQAKREEEHGIPVTP